MPSREYEVVPQTGHTARIGPTSFGLEWLIGDGSFRVLVVEYGLDDADECDARRQRPIVFKCDNLPVHRDQSRRIGLSQSVQFAAAAITHIHKNAPTAEFGARVQRGRTPRMPV